MNKYWFWWKQSGYGVFLLLLLLSLFILWLFVPSQSNGSSNITNLTKDLWFSIFRPIPTPSPFSSDNTSSKGEKECKEFLESYFQKPFQKIRPAFLTNPVTRQPLEIDLYNEELKLGVEYNGRQHYEYNTYMHQNSKDRFQNQQYRDLLKYQMCQQHGIQLIIVPYTIKDIPHFLYQELHKLGF